MRQTGSSSAAPLCCNAAASSSLPVKIAGRSGPSATRAGQSSDINDQLGVIRRRLGQGVAKHDAALGIGVADFDRQALAGGQHIAGAEGIAGSRPPAVPPDGQCQAVSAFLPKSRLRLSEDVFAIPLRVDAELVAILGNGAPCDLQAVAAEDGGNLLIAQGLLLVFAVDEL